MPLLSVKLAGRSEVTVVWARTPLEPANVESKTAEAKTAKRCACIITCPAQRKPVSRQRYAPFPIGVTVRTNHSATNRGIHRGAWAQASRRRENGLTIRHT